MSGIVRAGGGAKTVAVFGFDAAESSQIRRIRALLDAGHQVSGFTMRRHNMNADFIPFWDNVHLGTVENENFLKRIVVLLGAVLKLLRYGEKIRRADVILARNFDLLLLAHAARIFALKPVPVIYECLDIHGVFTDRSAKGAVFRWVERRLLARSALLVVSSEGFLQNYFRPVQRYQGPAHLMENKIWFSGSWPERCLAAPAALSPAPTDAAQREDPAAPLVVGWVGSLRCAPSFDILTGAARLLLTSGENVEFAFVGNVHRHVLPHFDERIGSVPRTRYRGPYSYPDGLVVYRSLDLVWAQDLWQRGANSDWLLPNRIYEASYFGCLSVAVAGTETARVVAERGLGYVIEEASAEALAELLQGLSRKEITARRSALLARPATRFVSTRQDVDGMIEAALGSAPRRRSTGAPAGKPLPSA